MEVKIKDREREIEWIRMSLCMVEIGIEYIHADLIKRVFDVLNKKKGQYSLKDSAEIHAKWQEDWNKYFKEQQKKEIVVEAKSE
jgi:6-phosphogluconate dehydrogenase